MIPAFILLSKKHLIFFTNLVATKLTIKRLNFGKTSFFIDRRH